jgi:thymidine phosphorylase
MQRIEDSRALAKSLVAVANGAGLATSALITDMNEPLASAAGNAVEVMNAVEFLTGARVDRRLHEVTVALGGEVLATAGLAANDRDGRDKIAAAFASGRAAEIFGQMVAGLGGPADFVDKPARHLKAAPVVVPAVAARPGVVAAIDARAIGIAVVELGGGRARAADAINHSVGFTRLAGLGARVGGADAPLALVHARDAAAAARAEASLRAAYTVGDTPAPVSNVIYERIG